MNLRYAFLNSKLRAMKTKSLSQRSQEELLKQESLKSAIMALKENVEELKNLNDKASITEVENEIRKTEVNDISKIIKILSNKDKEFIKIFISKYEILETKEYFYKIIKKMKNMDSDVKDLIGKRIDLLNILNIYRIKKFYSVSEEDIKKMIIDYDYKLKKAEIEKMIKADGYKQVEDIIKLSWYSKIVKDLDKQDLQNIIDNYIYNVAKSIFLKNRFNMGQVISYLVMEEYQNRNLITILEGIYYNIAKEEIKKKIII